MRTTEEVLDIVRRVDNEFGRIFNAQLKYEVLMSKNQDITILVYWQGGRLAFPVLSNHTSGEAVRFLVEMIAKNIKRLLGVDKLSYNNAKEISINGTQIRENMHQSENKVPYERRNSAIFDEGDGIPDAKDVI